MALTNQTRNVVNVCVMLLNLKIKTASIKVCASWWQKCQTQEHVIKCDCRSRMDNEKHLTYMKGGGMHPRSGGSDS